MTSDRHIPCKKTLPRIIFTLFICAAALTVVFEKAAHSADLTTNFSGGDGSEENPYLISSLEDLAALSDVIAGEKYAKNAKENEPQVSEEYLHYSGAHYLQTADIDASPVELWQPIGSKERPFEGIYDGGDYKISNITYGGAGESGREGLFGFVSGALKRVKVENGNEQIFYKRKDLGSSIGMVVGCVLNGGVVEKCTSSGFFNLALDKKPFRPLIIGGIVGIMEKKSGVVEQGQIVDCENRTVFNIHYDLKSSAGLDSYVLGGVVGASYKGNVAGCRNDGNILFSAKNTSVCLDNSNLKIGGIAGITFDTNIINCLNTGNITMEDRNYYFAEITMGGIVGDLAMTGEISLSSNIGDINVEGGSYSASNISIGGVVGSLTGTISQSSNKGSLVFNPEDIQHVRMGGIAGSVYDGRIQESSNFGHMRTNVEFINTRDPVTRGSDSYSVRELIAKIYCGGVFGSSYKGEHSNVSNTGDIYIHAVMRGMKSEIYAGGIGGEIEGTPFQNALNTSMVKIERVSPITKRRVGKIVGSILGQSHLAACYWLDTSDGTPEILGVGDDQSDDEVRAANNASIKRLSQKEIADVNSYPGWDFENIWEIPESGLRLLRLRNAADAEKINEVK